MTLIPTYVPRTWRQLMLLAIVLLLASCGFHLRGAYQLPEFMKTTYLQAAKENSELVRALKHSLKANDIQLVKTKQQAQASLRLFEETREKRVISVDSRGRAREYEITYQLSFELTALGSDRQFEVQTIKLEREFLFDVEDVLAKDREEASLDQDMQQDMVRLIMLRLQAMTQ